MNQARRSTSNDSRGTPGIGPRFAQASAKGVPQAVDDELVGLNAPSNWAFRLAPWGERSLECGLACDVVPAANPRGAAGAGADRSLARGGRGLDSGRQCLEQQGHPDALGRPLVSGHRVSVVQAESAG